MKDSVLIKLFILSKLLTAPANPYYIYKEHKNSLVAKFAQIEEAKFYYNIDVLYKQAYISQTSVEQGDNAPNKKIYEITDAGRAFFESSLYEKFASATCVENLYLPFSLLTFVDVEKVKSILATRITELENELQDFSKSVGEDFLADYVVEKRQFNITHLKHMLEIIKD